MKTIFFVLVLCFSLSLAQATDYYVSSSTGNDANDGLSAATAWKNFSKFGGAAGKKLAPGDRVLFRRGDKFTVPYTSGSTNLLEINASWFSSSSTAGTGNTVWGGTSGNPIVFSTYGDPADPKPLFQGKVTIPGTAVWSQNGKLWSTTSVTLPTDGSSGATPAFAQLFVGSSERRIAQYPNTGFLTVTGVPATAPANTNSFTCTALPATPSFVGAEGIVRYRHWAFTRLTISSHVAAGSGSSITLGSNALYNLQTNYQFVLQNHANAIDQDYEWAYYGTPKILYVQLPAGQSPANTSLEFSGISRGIFLNGSTTNRLGYLIFDGLRVESCSRFGFLINTSEFVVVKNCEVENTGQNAFHGSISPGLTLENNTINEAANNGIQFLAGMSSGSIINLIKGNTITNVGLVSGQTNNTGGGSQYCGMALAGNNFTIEDNSLQNIGYAGIYFTDANNTIVQRNLVKNFCSLMDDGGGIYTWTAIGQNNVNRRIENNIVRNGIGAPAGTSDQISLACGIYCDDRSDDVIINNNTVENVSQSGIYLHHAEKITVTNNNVFDAKQEQMFFLHSNDQTFSQLMIANNQFVAADPFSLAMRIRTQDNSVASFGSFADNVYARPLFDNTTIRRFHQPTGAGWDDRFTLARWKSTYPAYDVASKTSPRTFPLATFTGPNQIANGTFDSGIAGWAGSTTAVTLMYNGGGSLGAGGSLDMVSSGAGTALEQVVSVGGIQAGKTYLIHISLKNNANDNNYVQIEARDASTNAIVIPSIPSISLRDYGNEIRPFLVTATGSSTNYRFRITVGPEDGPVSIDNVSLQEVTLANPADYLQMVINETSASSTFSLTENYVSAAGTEYPAGTYTLAPFSSIILLKDSITPSIKVLNQNGDGDQTGNNQLKPNLQLMNTGSRGVDYAGLKVRYWFTPENFAPITSFIDWAQVGTTNVKMTYVGLAQPRENATGYVEYSFAPSAGSLVGGANSGPIQSRIAKQNWTDFNELNDYSFTTNTGYDPNNRLTAYYNGVLIWGVEPALAPKIMALTVNSENKNYSPTTNTISTYLTINNEGNVPVSYKDLSVRYWFTAEGTQPLNYWIDYAVVGASKVKGTFVKLSPARNGADTYFEIKVDSTLESLEAQSSTGNIQYRLAKNDWSAFNEADDHSYLPAGPMAINGNVTIYLKDQNGIPQLVAGREPSAFSGSRLGLTGGENRLRVAAYPSPASEQIRVDVQGVSNEAVRLQLVDITGRLITEKQIEASANERFSIFNVQAIPAGLYLLRISTPSQRATLKVNKL